MISGETEEEVFVDTEQLAAADLEDFQAANTDGTGQMTLSQFLAYAGATEDDADQVERFRMYV